MKGESAWIVERHIQIADHTILLVSNRFVPGKQALYKTMMLPPADRIMACVWESPTTSDYGEVVGCYHEYVNQCKHYEQE